MSGHPRGRGGGRGGDRGGPRGGGRGGSRGRGDSPARGSDRGGRGRGGGGPPGRGGSQTLSHRGPPPGSGAGGIYLGGQAIPQPDAQITAAENALVQVTRDRMFPLGTEGAEAPGRRGYGNNGAKIILRTNYFKINTAYEDKRPNMERTWYRYDVDVTPEPSKSKRHRVFEKIVTHPKFKGVVWASDYAKILVTTTALDLGGGEWKEKIDIPPEVVGPQATEQGPPPDFVLEARERNRVQFRIVPTGAFTPRHIIDYLRSTSPGADYANALDLIQMFNIIMCRAPNSANNVVGVGQNRFYPHEGHPGVEFYDLGGGLEAMRGYYTSVRPAVGRLLLNLNVTSGAFYKPIPLADLMNEFRGSMDQRENFISRVKVRAVYKRDGEQQPFMVKIKSVIGFAKQLEPPTFRVKRFGNANEVKFRFKDSNAPDARERELTVAEYFHQHHGITLQSPGAPVLNCGTRRDPQYMPLELCTVVPGQAYRDFLSGDQTSDMLKFAARPPNLNGMSISGVAQSPGNGVRLFRLKDPQGDPQTQSVQPWGFRVGVHDLLTVPGRILSNPAIKYLVKQEHPRNGSWNCADQKFFKPGRFGRWQVLVINRGGFRGNALNPNPHGDVKAPEQLFQELERFLRAYGLQMGQRATTQTLSLDALTVENRATNNRKLELAYQNADEEGVRFLFIVLPEADRWLYARIKYYGDIKYGIHTINSVGSKLQKPGGQGMYMGNLALKFNIKSGGVNHIVPNTFMKPLDNNTMLMGIDVTHPSPGSKQGAPSISCLVGSIDEHLTQWPGSVRTQTGQQEMVDGLEEMVLERLDLWQKLHQNHLPGKIILYRDGVSEGQYDQVLLKELPFFYKAFERRYGAEKNWPKVAVIIVGKRHHTRFYPTKPEDADYNPQRDKGSWNPKPGTIVDRHISGRILREFWLQAHQGLQGTARPAHYVVLKDDIAFEADELETFTHNLCYLFNRATKAVSICPPAYYADLLCERGRAYLFSTLAENHGSSSSMFDGGDAEWRGGVHPRLAESTWYI